MGAKSCLLILPLLCCCSARAQEPQIKVHCDLHNAGEVLNAKTGKPQKFYEATCDITLSNGRVLMPPTKLVLPQNATYGEASEAIHEWLDEKADGIILEALRKK